MAAGLGEPKNGSGLALVANGDGLEGATAGYSELDRRTAGGSDSRVAATCDDHGLDSASSTVKANPAIHSAKLM